MECAGIPNETGDDFQATNKEEISTPAIETSLT
jgi:hypothetical protein